MRTSLALALSVPLVAGCPKKLGSSSGAVSGTEIVVQNRAPVQCTKVAKEEGKPEVEAFEPRGCNASIRFRLSPSGKRDVDLPYFRDANRAQSADVITEGEVVERIVLLRDSGGERLWAAEFPESELPWTDKGPCVRSPDLHAFDLSVWRFLVVSVQTRDAYGTRRPMAEAQPDTLRLKITEPGDEAFRPAVVASTSHPGVWAAAWCAKGDGGYELELDVRGAYQLETDTFAMPDPSKDTYTTLDYVLEPIAVDEAL